MMIKIKLKQAKEDILYEDCYGTPQEDAFDSVFLGRQYVHPIEVQYATDDLLENAS